MTWTYPKYGRINESEFTIEIEHSNYYYDISNNIDILNTLDDTFDAYMEE